MIGSQVADMKHWVHLHPGWWVDLIRGSTDLADNWEWARELADQADIMRPPESKLLFRHFEQHHVPRLEL